MTEQSVELSAQPTRVFISYSRSRSSQTQRLRDELRLRGFEVYLDQYDILPGEPWQERLLGLINAAHAVVFCISPEFLASPICAWEVETSDSLGKKVLPLIVHDLAGAHVPERLARLNYIFARDSDEFAEALEQLCLALALDIEWVREHTRLGEIARRWLLGGRAEHALLRDNDVTRAVRWLARRPTSGSEVISNIVDLIEASRGARDAHWRREALRLLQLARNELIGGDFVTAALLLLEALPTDRNSDRPIDNAILSALYGAWARTREFLTIRLGAFPVVDLDVSTDGKLLLAATTEAVFVIDATSGSTVARIEEKNTTCVAIANDRAVTGTGNRLAFWDLDDGALIWQTRKLYDVRAINVAKEDRRLLILHGDAASFIKPESGEFQRLNCEYDSIAAVAISHDAEEIAIVSCGRIELWDGNSHEKWAELKSSVSEAQNSAGISFSPDGALLALCVRGPAVEIWDDDEVPLQRLQGHTARVTAVGFSPKAAHLATGSADGVIHLFNIRNENVRDENVPKSHVPDSPARLVLHGHEAAVTSVAFLSEESRLATGADDGTIRFWNTGPNARIVQLQQCPKDVTTLLFSPDGAVVATGAHDHTVSLWSVASGCKTATVSCAAPVTSLAVSSDGSRIGAGCANGEVYVWSLKGFTPVAKVATGSQGVTALSLSNTGERLAAALGSRGAVFDCVDGSLLGSYDDHNAAVDSLAFVCGDTRLATRAGGTLRAFDLAVETGALIGGVPFGEVWDVALSPDGAMLLVSARTKVCILETTSLRTLATHDVKNLYPDHRQDRIRRTVLSPDGARLACIASNDSAFLVDVDSGTTLADLTNLGSGLGVNARDSLYSSTDIKFSPDSRLLARIGYRGDLVEVSNAADGALYAHFGRGAYTDYAWITDVAFSPDSQRLALAHYDGCICIHEVENKRVFGTLIDADKCQGTLPTPISEIKFSPDGKKIAARFMSRVHIYDTATGQKLLQVEAENASDCAFSPNGQKLAVSGAASHTAIWNIQSGERLCVLAGHVDQVSAIRFSPSGTEVITAGCDGTTRIWTADDGRELARLEARVSCFDIGPKDLIATGGSSAVCLWRTNRAPVAHYASGRTQLTTFAASPDGSLLHGGNADGLSLLWNAANARILSEKVSPGGPILATVTTADDQQISTVFDDGSLVTFDGMHWPCLLAAGREPRSIRVVAFSSNGAAAAVLWANGELEIWRLFQDAYDFLDKVRADMPRALSPEQRHRFHLAERVQSSTPFSS